ncbi:MAG: 1,2-phenylacetyl-CoA epoxidase subunit PaaC [Pseudonocardiaceae bacterium]
MTDDENVYAALTATEGHGNGRWAFGTGFDDPLTSVDTSVPEGVDRADLAAYCLMLGDDALIMSHRLAEWCSHAPELEEEVALANIGLDLLGQARLLLAHAGLAEAAGRDEDALAYFRDEREFRNVRLAELPNGDFARSTARLLLFSTWRLAALQRLTTSRDTILAAVAAKGVKELTYHRDYAARWTVRLGDGTEISRERMQRGLAGTWPFVDELFSTHDIERRLVDARVTVDPAGLRAEFDDVTGQVLTAAGLEVPDVPGLAGVAGRAGRDGVHTETMGHLLAEMQSLARAHPEARW